MKAGLVVILLLLCCKLNVNNIFAHHKARHWNIKCKYIMKINNLQYKIENYLEIGIKERKLEIIGRNVGYNKVRGCA